MATATQAAPLSPAQQRIIAFDAFIEAGDEQERLYRAYQAIEDARAVERDNARVAYLQACDRTLVALAEYERVKLLCGWR